LLINVVFDIAVVIVVVLIACVVVAQLEIIKYFLLPVINGSTLHRSNG